MMTKRQTSLMHDCSDCTADDVVLVHSSDLHVDDDLGMGAYNGLIALRYWRARRHYSPRQACPSFCCLAIMIR
jgi:hypothetical protein